MLSGPGKKIKDFLGQFMEYFVVFVVKLQVEIIT